MYKHASNNNVHIQHNGLDESNIACAWTKIALRKQIFDPWNTVDKPRYKITSTNLLPYQSFHRKGDGNGQV